MFYLQRRIQNHSRNLGLERIMIVFILFEVTSKHRSREGLMAKSLQEQLLGAGLVDKKKAKNIQKEKRVQRKQTPKGQAVQNEAEARIAQQKKEKAERDKALNQAKLEEQNRKAIKAQVKQLIEMNTVPSEGDDIGFQFAVDKKIKKVYISEQQQTHLLKGRLAIANLDESFILIPATAATKIIERDEAAIVYHMEKSQPQDTEIEEDDPYKDYQIPDDLMW
jgi:uncharacterized protein YaiL (DUF2058 family)